MLNIVNKSPAQSNALQSCLRVVQEGHCILLIEDAVYAAVAGGLADLEQLPKGVKVYALLPDLEARAMAGRCIEGVETVDYGGFVDLVAAQPTCQSWL